VIKHTFVINVKYSQTSEDSKVWWLIFNFIHKSEYSQVAISHGL